MRSFSTPCAIDFALAMMAEWPASSIITATPDYFAWESVMRADSK